MSKARAFFYVCAGALCLAAMIVAVVVPSVGAGAKLAPGEEPYSPSKLEWAAIELNEIVNAEEWRAGEALFSRFQAGTDGVTLTCLLRYKAVATAGSLEDVRNAVRGAVEQYARTRGWSWLKVRFDEEVVE